MPVADGKQRIIDLFADLADALVDAFDVIEFLHVVALRCVDALACDAAGMLLGTEGGRGPLRVVGSSSERSESLELLQSLDGAGPCVDSLTRGEIVVIDDLARDAGRWPRFAQPALDRGVRAVHSIPIRVRGETVGALNLFRNTTWPMHGDDLRLVQALADIAAVGLMHERVVRGAHAVADQLQGALNSRVVIEQAKGMLAGRAEIDIEDAFGLLRGYARGHNRLLGDVARDVVEGRLEAAQMRRAVAAWGRRAS